MDENNIDPYFSDWTQEAIDLMGENAGLLVDYVEENKIDLKSDNLRPFDIYGLMQNESQNEVGDQFDHKSSEENLSNALNNWANGEDSSWVNNPSYETPIEAYTPSKMSPSELNPNNQTPPNKYVLNQRLLEALTESENRRLNNG